MNVVFFEDAHIARFYPNALTRPLDDMRFGALTLREKWLADFRIGSFTRLLRPWLEGVYENPVPDPRTSWYWINSRFVPDRGRLSGEIDSLTLNCGLVCDGVPVVLYLSGESTRSLLLEQEQYSREFWDAVDVQHLPEDPVRYNHVELDFSNYEMRDTTAGRLLDHAWDFTHHNGEEITRDVARIKSLAVIEPSRNTRFYSENPDEIYVGSNVRIGLGALLDASDGPILLDKNAEIMPGAMIRGPVYLGENSLVRMGAKIYEGTTAGPFTKLGGETSSVIFQGYSNKAHEGYIGNSLIGEWVNIGADTNNSNLKNNYTPVKVFNWETGELEDSGLQFCGVFLADHVKTAINSMLNSGTVCGVNSSVLTNNFPPKYIPSFGWVTDTSIDVFGLARALQTARTMMARRGLTMSDAYERMMRYLFTVRDGRGGAIQE